MSDERTIRWGDDEVAVHVRAWRSARINGYRQTYRLRPGEAWADAPVSANQYEHLVDLDGEIVPVGVAIARELVDGGADWAFCTELWGSGEPVLLGPNAICAPIVGGVAELLRLVREVNGHRLGGLRDVIGRHGDRFSSERRSSVMDVMRCGPTSTTCYVRFVLDLGTSSTQQWSSGTLPRSDSPAHPAKPPACWRELAQALRIVGPLTSPTR